MHFNAIGLAAGLFTTVTASIQSIFSKKVMQGIDHLNLLVGTSRLCCLCMTPIW